MILLILFLNMFTIIQRLPDLVLINVVPIAAIQYERDHKYSQVEEMLSRTLCKPTVPSVGSDSVSVSPTPPLVRHDTSRDHMTSPEDKMVPLSRCHRYPARSSSSPVTFQTGRKQSFQLVDQRNGPVKTLTHNARVSYNDHIERESPTVCSDYERCSLDFEPDRYMDELDAQTSEDELTIINCNRDAVREKRKWSQVNRCNSCEDSSASSDDEVRDIFMEPTPLNFSSSPPKGVQKLTHTLSPKVFLANISTKNVRLCCVSPRKRHRQINSTDVSDATVIQRPCLDFEKMQVSNIVVCNFTLWCTLLSHQPLL